jgi:hypothetical protein
VSDSGVFAISGRTSQSNLNYTYHNGKLLNCVRGSWLMPSIEIKIVIDIEIVIEIEIETAMA